AVLDRLRHVIQHAETPSWVSSVPYNFGAAAAGMPKVDKWCTVFTIHLPITFILLLGLGSLCASDDNTSALSQILDHTMQLVCAVLLACKHATTLSHIQHYQQYMQNYVSQLSTLFPNLEHESIHHMAFHISDFLKLFGPVHSWWCFPFERLIGKL
ncbi:uncharacterized protein LAESUDRAFT_615925, partial [Laetiporus sulphureus 93-53]